MADCLLQFALYSIMLNEWIFTILRKLIKEMTIPISRCESLCKTIKRMIYKNGI